MESSDRSPWRRSGHRLDPLKILGDQIDGGADRAKRKKREFPMRRDPIPRGKRRRLEGVKGPIQRP